ncbi:MAG: Bacterial regulatory protein luxR family [Planctomycetota bacterium]|jgi:DNA-binding CsgD family transcriptional regulator
MEEAIVDIRNAAAMETLFDEEAMAAWELLRRRGKPTPAVEVARVTHLDFITAQRKLDRLHEHGLVELLPARAGRRVPTYRTTCKRIGIVLRSNDKEDYALWDSYGVRVREAAERLARNQRPLGESTADERARAFYVMPLRLSQFEMAELRHRLDDLTAFLRMLQERHSGERGEDDFGCNYRFEMQLQPLAEPMLPQPVVLMRLIDREPSHGVDRVDPMMRLSQRERQVAQCIVRGRSRSETAEELLLRPGTIATLTKRIYRKLGVTNRIELARCFSNVQRGTPDAVA